MCVHGVTLVVKVALNPNTTNQHMYTALTYDVIKSYLTRVQDKKILNGYITLETSIVM